MSNAAYHLRKKTNILLCPLKTAHYRIVSFLIMASLSLLIALSISQPVMFSSDSACYTDISSTLINEHLFATHILNLNSNSIPDHSLLWPPAYPCLLAIPQIFGISEVQSARLVSIFSVLVIACAGAALCFAVNPSAPFKLCFLLILFFISQIKVVNYFWSLQLFAYAWSEPLFIAFMLVSLFFYIKHLRDGRLIWLLMGGGVSAFAFLTKYIGLSLAVIGPIVILQNLYLKNRLTPLVFK